MQSNADYSSAARLRTFLHQNLIGLVRGYYNRVWGMHIGEGTRISLSAKLDRTNPRGVFIGRSCALAFEASVLTHDFVNGRHLETRIGDFCFIGARAVVMPGVTIGDHCIIGTGSIVLRNVPDNSVVMGNPARVIEKGVMTAEFGRRVRSATVSAAAATEPDPAASRSD